MSARVLRLITRMNIGGPARQASLLTKQLSDRYPTLLAAGKPSHSEGELLDPDVPLTYVPLHRGLRPYQDLRSLVKVKGLISDWEPSLIHTHMAKAGTVGRTAAALSRPRPVTVHTFHGHVLEGYFGRAMERTFITIERRLARRTDALVAVSEEIRDDLLNLGIGTEDRWHVIQLGFDLSTLLAVTEPSGRLREDLGLADDVPLIGVLGRLAPIKDHHTLLDAMTRLDGVHLAVLGDGELREQLTERSRALGMENRVHMVGWWLDVPSAMADLDAVVLTSRNEGTPVSLIEALAAGKPVVSTDVGGVRAVVDDGETGLLVPPGDPAETARALAALLADPQRRSQMGETGRTRMAIRFNKDRLIADIKTLYRSLLD